MKMRWMAIVVVALMTSACGGTEEESTDARAPHANVNSVVQPPAEDQLAPPDCGPEGCDVGYFCCGKNVCCAIM